MPPQDRNLTSEEPDNDLRAMWRRLNGFPEQEVKPFVTKTRGVLTKEMLLQIYRELNPLAHSVRSRQKVLQFSLTLAR